MTKDKSFVNNMDQHSWRPKLRENIWHMRSDAEPDDPAFLITSKAKYELPAQYVRGFLKIRPYCTGHNSLSTIAEMTQTNADDLLVFFNTFSEIDLLYPDSCESLPLDRDGINQSLINIISIWAGELHSVYIANELAREQGLSRGILIGWMTEMYHYVKDFPLALQCAADNAEGELKLVLECYANEELGHEVFVLDTLRNLGVSAEEVASSTPLISTRAIGLLLRELLSDEPSATLLAAALLEAADFDEDNIGMYQQKLAELYNIPLNALAPYFEHQKIDFDLGHQRLLSDNLGLINITELDRLDNLINKLHDLKHAFELQSLEIKAYYGEPRNGRHVQRPAMKFHAI